MRHFLLAALLCLSAAPAAAQYQWIDQGGQMVFSDQPPPASVPLSRILRVGDPIARPRLPADADSQQASQEPPKSRQELLADRVKAFDERREKRAEARKKAEEAKLASAAKAERCQRLQSRMASINSGIRMTRSTTSGERAFLSDRERSELGKRTRKQLSACS